MEKYWRNHLVIDIGIAVASAAALWSLPIAGVGPIFIADADAVPEVLSKWLAGCLTLIGLIIATTGFLTSLLQNDDFAPLAKSASVSQL